MKGVSVVLPVVTGTIAFWLAKKVRLLGGGGGSTTGAAGSIPRPCPVRHSPNRAQATEHASHKWTVYLRHANSQDLSYLLSKARELGGGGAAAPGTLSQFCRSITPPRCECPVIPSLRPACR